MNDYTELTITATPCSEDTTDLLAAFLADLGYESFVASESGLTAYIKAESFDENVISEMIAGFPIPADFSFESKFVEGRDWNEEWEKNYFRPIVVRGRCAVHSSFHTDVPEAEYDIVIDPRLAFGTGHHSTTSLMLSYLLDLDIEGKTVTDVGTGTAILAILASMRGAEKVYGIEIDPFAKDNAVDNVAINHAEAEIILGDASALAPLPQADILIANINRNIITADLPAYCAALRDGGTMLLSGFYEADIPVVMKAAGPLGLTLEETRTDKDWAGIRLKKG